MQSAWYLVGIGGLLWGLISGIRIISKKKQIKQGFKHVGIGTLIFFIGMVGGGIASNNKQSQIAADKLTAYHKTPEYKEKVAKQKAEALAKKQAEQKKKAEEKAKKKAEEKTIIAVVHLDDVSNLPKYTIKTYKEGDEIPAANESSMNCTNQKCYKVIFEVDGSGQNPTAEYKSLSTKLENRNILDASYDGSELPTVEVGYWTKGGMITTRFYK